MKRVCQVVQVFVFSGAAVVLCSTPAFSQQILNDGGAGVPVSIKLDKAAGTGPRQQAGSGSGIQLVGNSNPSGGVAYYTANYTSFGRSYPFNIIGTNPSQGAGVTTIPTVIVPLRITFPGGAVLDGTNVMVSVASSPIFLAADYTTGGTDIGVTQYGDAIQRAEFWNLPGFSPAGYHVLLTAPLFASTVSLTVPTSGCPASVHNPTGACGTTYGNGAIGVVAGNWFDAQINNLIHAYAPNVLPIFLTDNVFEASDGTAFTCCTLGYHNSEGPPAATAHTWIYAAYTEPNTFQSNDILDVQALSHEVAEWMNDPFVGAFALGFINLIPPAVLPGQGGACIPNFEVADPLEAPPVVFTQVTNSTTYHLQDAAFLSWYMHSNFGVNGKYSYLGTFTTPSTLCGPG